MRLFAEPRAHKALVEGSTVNWSNKVFANASFVPKLQGKMLGRTKAKVDRHRLKCCRFEDRHFAREANGQPVHFLASASD